MKDYIIKMEDVSVRVYDRIVLKNTFFELKKGMNLLIIGPNGSGKSTFAGAIAGKVPVVRGKTFYNINQNKIEFVAFEEIDRLIKKEALKEEARFFSSDSSKTTVSDILGEDLKDKPLPFSGLQKTMNRDFFKLSTGEKRKVLILKALFKGPELIILDEPFEGLDKESCRIITEVIENIIKDKIQVIIISHKLEMIPESFKTVILIKNLELVKTVHRKDLDNKLLTSLYSNKIKFDGIDFHGSKKKYDPVVMKNLNIIYGKKVVHKNLSWTVKQGENWKISGPNGSGKSTLLSLIYADNLQGYSNEIYLFGRRRGTGESVFDIKRRTGLVSPELQFRYQKKIPVLDVVLSGFFDSIGLYRKPADSMIQKAENLLLNAGFDTGKRLDHLSFGERRMVFILRAIVKSPELLLLDEPCQGLDPYNRKEILNLIDKIAQNSNLNIIYVSHDNENLKCINRELILKEKNSYKIIHRGE